MKPLPVLLLVIAAAVAGAAAGYALGSGGRDAPPAAPAPAPTAAAPSAAPPAANQAAQAPRRVEDPHPANWPEFSIELAAFRTLPAAREFEAEMQRRKLTVEVVETVDAGGRSWYRVRWGRFADPRQAAGRLGEIQQAAGIAGIVTGELPVNAASGDATGH